MRRMGSMLSRRSAQAPQDTRMVYLANWATGSYYTLSDGEAGVGTGFGLYALVTPLTLTGTNRVIFSVRTASANGAALTMTTTNAFRFTCLNGVGTATAVTGTAVAGGDAGKLFEIIGIYTGSNTIRLYVNGVQQSTDTACVGYTPSTFPTRIGADGISGSAGAGIGVFACGGFRGVPSSEEIAAHYAATKARRDIVTTIGSTAFTHAWSAKRSYAGSVPSTLANISGSGDLAKVGTPTATVLTSDQQVWGS